MKDSVWLSSSWRSWAPGPDGLARPRAKPFGQEPQGTDFGQERSLATFFRADHLHDMVDRDCLCESLKYYVYICRLSAWNESDPLLPKLRGFLQLYCRNVFDGSTDMTFPSRLVSARERFIPSSCG